MDAYVVVDIKLSITKCVFDPILDKLRWFIVCHDGKTLAPFEIKPWLVVPAPAFCRFPVVVVPPQITPYEVVEVMPVPPFAIGTEVI